MAIRQRGKGWQVDIRCPKTGKRQRPQFDTEAEARSWETAAKEAFRLGKNLPERSNCKTQGSAVSTLGQLVRHTERIRWRNLKSADTQVAAAMQTVDYFGENLLVTEIKQSHVYELVDHLVDRGLSNATVNRKLSAFSVMVKEGRRLGVIKESFEFPRFREYQSRFRFLTQNEADKLLGLLKHWNVMDVHDFTMLALDTGMRLSEVLRTDWASFSGDFKHVTVWVNKADDPRTLRLTQRCREMITSRQLETGDMVTGPFKHLRRDGHLRRTFDKACDHLGWSDVTIHTLRHTCASWLVQRGKDLRRVQKYMGHKTIHTTLRYAHLAPNDLDECTEAMEAVAA